MQLLAGAMTPIFVHSFQNTRKGDAKLLVTVTPAVHPKRFQVYD
jgi:hypothetical protein